MTYGENIWIFSALLLGGILLPGPDMIFVLANSLAKGRQAGLAATMGLVVGGLVHSAYAGFGVGLLTNLIPVLFKPMAFAGAIYMAWIGWTLVRSSIVVTGMDVSLDMNNWDAFRRGIVTCLLNPKAYLFMIAVYPQFLKPEFGPLLPQALLMTFILAAIQIGVYGSLAVATSQVHQITTNRKLTIWLGRLCGSWLIVVSCVTMWTAFAE